MWPVVKMHMIKPQAKSNIYFIFCLFKLVFVLSSNIFVVHAFGIVEINWIDLGFIKTSALGISRAFIVVALLRPWQRSPFGPKISSRC